MFGSMLNYWFTRPRTVSSMKKASSMIREGGKKSKGCAASRSTDLPYTLNQGMQIPVFSPLIPNGMRCIGTTKLVGQLSGKGFGRP